MEPQAVFQAKIQAQNFLLNWVPASWTRSGCSSCSPGWRGPATVPQRRGQPAGSADMLQWRKRMLEYFTRWKMQFYRLIHLAMHLGWVDFELLNSHQSRKNWAGSATLNIQVNPTQSTSKWIALYVAHPCTERGKESLGFSHRIGKFFDSLEVQGDHGGLTQDFIDFYIRGPASLPICHAISDQFLYRQMHVHCPPSGNVQGLVNCFQSVPHRWLLYSNFTCQIEVLTFLHGW